MNAGKKPEDCKMVARAIFSFQAQNNRELSFKKGDVIYIKKQVRSTILDENIMIFRWIATGTRENEMQCLGSSQRPMLRSFLRMLSLVRFSKNLSSKNVCQLFLSSPGEHPLQERAKHGWSCKGQVQLHRTNSNGGFLPQRYRHILNVTKSKMVYSYSFTQVNLLFSHDASTRTGSKAG